MPIPKHIIEKGLKLAKGSLIYGEKIEDLSADELKALLALFADENQKLIRERTVSQKENFLDYIKSRR